MRSGAILALAVLVTACGGHRARSPEEVARAWSAALNRADDEAAAQLFAPSAEIVQGGELVLRDHDDAVTWNASLPCGGAITRVIREADDQVLVVFRLKDRPRHTCDAPGQDAAALFKVEGGKIVLWHQTDPPGESGDSPGGTPV
jgi:limonene-1,2-epoxide hydrolase